MGVATARVFSDMHFKMNCYSPEQELDDSLEGDMGVCVGDKVEKVAVPNSGDLGAPIEGVVVEKSVILSQKA